MDTTHTPKLLPAKKLYAGVYLVNGGTHLAIAADHTTEWAVHDLRGLSPEQVEAISCGLDENWVRYEPTLRDAKHFAVEACAAGVSL